jgi:hypothetical protein
MLDWLGFTKTNISSSKRNPWEPTVVTVGELASLIDESFREYASIKHEGQSLNFGRP